MTIDDNMVALMRERYRPDAFARDVSRELGISYSAVRGYFNAWDAGFNTPVEHQKAIYGTNKSTYYAKKSGFKSHRDKYPRKD